MSSPCRLTIERRGHFLLRFLCHLFLEINRAIRNMVADFELDQSWLQIQTSAGFKFTVAPRLEETNSA